MGPDLEHWQTADMDPVSTQAPAQSRLVLVDDNPGLRHAAERFLDSSSGCARAGMAAGDGR